MNNQTFDNANRIALFQTEDANVLAGHITFDDAAVKYPAVCTFVEDGAHIVRVFKPDSGAKGKPLLTGKLFRVPGGLGKSGEQRPTHKVQFEGKKEKRTYAVWSYPTVLTGQLESKTSLPLDQRW